MGLKYITFAGIDESCSVEELIALARKEPRLEYAFLYQDFSVQKPRYPSYGWILETAGRLRGAGVPLALHVCGNLVAEVVNLSGLTQLPARTFFDRIQLNAPIQEAQHASFGYLADWLAPTKVITQQPVNPNLHLKARRRTHQVVFDGSLGRGILPERWDAPLEGVFCGYSGGLGPETISNALPIIFDAAGKADFWIDMETGLRDEHNAFSIHRAERTLEAIAEVEARLTP